MSSRISLTKSQHIRSAFHSLHKMLFHFSRIQMQGEEFSREMQLIVNLTKSIHIVARARNLIAKNKKRMYGFETVEDSNCDPLVVETLAFDLSRSAARFVREYTTPRQLLPRDIHGTGQIVDFLRLVDRLALYPDDLPDLYLISAQYLSPISLTRLQKIKLTKIKQLVSIWLDDRPGAKKSGQVSKWLLAAKISTQLGINYGAGINGKHGDKAVIEQIRKAWQRHQRTKRDHVRPLYFVKYHFQPGNPTAVRFGMAVRVPHKHLFLWAPTAQQQQYPERPFGEMCFSAISEISHQKFFVRRQKNISLDDVKKNGEFITRAMHELRVWERSKIPFAGFDDYLPEFLDAPYGHDTR